MSSAAVPAVVARRAGALAACEARLRELLGDGWSEAVAGPGRDSLAAGGKRLRPLLVFCSAPLGHPEDELVAGAAAVELLHVATLVHDDLIDGAKLRRGEPTVAHRFGAERAVETGDFLFSLAFRELSRTGSVQAVQALAQASLDLSRGELIQGEQTDDLTLGESAYRQRCQLKSGALFAAACEIGAALGNAEQEEVNRLAGFGSSIGVAFQLFDDILDITGAPEDTGKARGGDLRDGTITLPVIYALEDEAGLASAITGARRGDDVDDTCARLASSPGIARTRDRALETVASARAELDAGSVNGADREALHEIAAAMVDRHA